jgi:hypothetical protein
VNVSVRCIAVDHSVKLVHFSKMTVFMEVLVAPRVPVIVQHTTTEYSVISVLCSHPIAAMVVCLTAIRALVPAHHATVELCAKLVL